VCLRASLNQIHELCGGQPLRFMEAPIVNAAKGCIPTVLRLNMAGINHDAPVIGVRRSTAKPNENSGRRDAVDEPRKIFPALLMAMQWRRAGDMIGRRACVGRVRVLRRYSARHKWWNCQSLPLVDPERTQHLA